MSSLFGNSASQPTNPFSGSLFGNSTNTANQQSSTGQQTNQPSAGGLFAHLVPKTQEQKTGGGLFGDTQTSQSQQQQPPSLGGSLFGASILNNSSGQTQAQNAGPLQSTAGQAPTNLSESRTSAHFDSLIERGRKRKGGPNGNAQFGDLPSLQLSLGDISGKLRNLGGTSAAATPRRRDGRA